jgi:hypothetical protein
MPDPEMLLKVMAASAGVAAAIVVVFGLMWWLARPVRVAAGWALGVATAFLLGCWWLNLPPRWSLREDRDRFLIVLVPAAVVVELLAAVCRLPSRVAWLLRFGVAAGIARVLLDGSVYLTQLEGAEDRKWSAGEAWLILTGLGIVFVGVWAMLSWQIQRGPTRTVPLALALTCAATGITIMYSGYLTGGQLGLPLAAALAGATAASPFFRDFGDARAGLGVGLVGLFGLLVVGRFFGELSTLHFGLLLAAPLLCCVPELPPARRAWPWLRGLAGVALVAGMLVIPVLQARHEPDEESQPNAAESQPASPAPTSEDYRKQDVRSDPAPPLSTLSAPP